MASVPISTFMCSVSDLYIPTNRSAYSAAGKYVDRSWEYINCSHTHEIGTEAAQLLFSEDIKGIFVAVQGTEGEEEGRGIWALKTVVCTVTQVSNF